MLHTNSLPPSRPRRSRSSRRHYTTALLATAAPVLSIFLLRPTFVAATASSTSSLSGTDDSYSPPLPIDSGAVTAEKALGPEDMRVTFSDPTDPLSRRKHVTFQDLNQLKGPSAPVHLAAQASDLDTHDAASPALLLYEDEPTVDLDATPHAGSARAPLSVSGSHSVPSSDTRRYDSQRSASRANVYNEDLVGKQTSHSFHGVTLLSVVLLWCPTPTRDCSSGSSLSALLQSVFLRWPYRKCTGGSV